MKYTHLKLDEEVCFPSGYYTPRKESRLKLVNREVLYVVGNVVVEAACCGSANWTYALVPGYIIEWQKEKSEDGLLVSEVELITDEAVRSEIRRAIQEAENTYAVEFW